METKGSKRPRSDDAGSLREDEPLQTAGGQYKGSRNGLRGKDLRKKKQRVAPPVYTVADQSLINLEANTLPPLLQARTGITTLPSISAIINSIDDPSTEYAAASVDVGSNTPAGHNDNHNILNVPDGLPSPFPPTSAYDFPLGIAVNSNIPVHHNSDHSQVPHTGAYDPHRVLEAFHSAQRLVEGKDAELRSLQSRCDVLRQMCYEQFCEAGGYKAEVERLQGELTAMRAADEQFKARQDQKLVDWSYRRRNLEQSLSAALAGTPGGDIIPQQIEENTAIRRQLRDMKDDYTKAEMAVRSLNGDLQTNTDIHKKRIAELKRELDEARMAVKTAE
ncbi:hypothetical protein LTR85_000128 [Meristemomyces frigidus]|nr:hypothetical protein LTR85_000128 [Meristemomyces frigidus]